MPADGMRVVALISGGKDSCYNMMQCVSAGHQIVALANLRPPEAAVDELDSYMYQTVGHHALELYAEAMGLPLYRATLKGTSLDIGRSYTPHEGDEVEDLYQLLKLVKEKESVDSVSVGAILSDYQRVRVENVCQRLGLQPLAFLWRRKQEELLDEMIANGLEAILIKVAAFGLDPDKHLGRTLEEMRPQLKKLSHKYGVHVCGEGGEYETLTLDCALFKKRVVVDSSEVVVHSNDAFAPVAYLRLLKLHLQDKDNTSVLDFKGECPCDLELTVEPVQCDMEHQSLTWLPQGLPSVSSCKTKKCPTKSQGGFLWISELISSGQSVYDASQRGLSTLNVHVEELGLKLKDAVLVHLYVRNMADFTTINNAYKTLFPEAPPARVCVQCLLPAETLFKLDGLFWYMEPDVCRDDYFLEKISMHVQSVSHWAPANIGPYSQAIRVGPAVFCAGQIALKPCTMRLVPGGITAEADVSLHHVERVLGAMSPGTSLSHVLLCHCYVTQSSYIPTAVAAWAKTQKDTSASISVVVVPELPRGAAVEWHVVAAVSDPLDRRCISTTEENLGYRAILYGVVSSCLSCASLTVSLAVSSPGLPCQDWSPARQVLITVLRRAIEELPGETPLTPLCCRTFYKSEGSELRGLQTGLEGVLVDVWGDTAPTLVLVPVSGLSISEVLHLSLWFSS
ncbi:diphthine--ammonia ligase [Spea bombifrons]|uniref:diphthine--ammonia ligase n=1 Tax=Spea bombifrons TaxID=233779 RepID=UPI00234A1CC8|nr:diphthine--ammonia ligase [Spea bombifrons]